MAQKLLLGDSILLKRWLCAYSTCCCLVKFVCSYIRVRAIVHSCKQHLLLKDNLLLSLSHHDGLLMQLMQLLLPLHSGKLGSLQELLLLKQHLL